MKIGILSKQEHRFTGKLKTFFENNRHNVQIYTKENLCINDSLLENDFYILKSKTLFFLYAGFYAEANNIPVIPNPDISYKHKNRLEANLLRKNVGILYPDYYYGTLEALKNNLKDIKFPLILKPIIGSGSRGVKKIEKIEDINANDKKILYLEKYIEGIHYLAYFIENEICVLEKPPLSNEHVPMKKVSLLDDIKHVVLKWKNRYNLLFGHLDIVKENKTNKFYSVDTGNFPEFSNWKNESDPVSKIGNSILKEFKKISFKN